MSKGHPEDRKEYHYNPVIGGLLTYVVLALAWVGVALLGLAALYAAVQFIHWAWNN
jgi:hypothetical protein